MWGELVNCVPSSFACRFDQLRIQRQIHSSDGKRAARGQASNKARLMFEAHLNTIHGAITVSAFSRPIILGKSTYLLSVTLSCV